MKKHNLLLVVWLGLTVYIFSPTDFAKAALLTCGGDKTEADCVSAGGTVADAGGCTVCKIANCPSGMTRYREWTNFASKTCGDSISSCTTGSSWINSRTLNCFFEANGHYVVNDFYSNCHTVSETCPPTNNGDRLMSQNCYKGCVANDDTLQCNYYGRVGAVCSATQTQVACIGSGTTPAVVNSCQGTVSPNASAWDTEESSSLTNSQTKWTCSASDTEAKCQYKCNPNFSCFSDNLRTGCVPPAPAKPTVTCDSNGIITVNGPTVAGEGIWYAVRIDDTIDGWDPNNLSLKDQIFDNLPTYNKIYQGEIGKTYRVWGNAVVENGEHDLWAIQTTDPAVTVTCGDNDDTTVNFSCTNIPANSNICSGSNAGLTDNTPATLVSDCNASANQKCQYVCKDKYVKNEDTCVLISSTMPNLCGPAGSRDRNSSEAWYDIYAGGFRGKFCVNAEPTVLPIFPPTGGHVEWTCYDTAGANPQKCYVRRNSNGSPNGNTNTDANISETCQNFPPASFCAGGTSDIIVTGKDDNNCPVYNCKSSPSITGVIRCGTADKKFYEATNTSFGNDTLCASGIASPLAPVFPDEGKIVEWKCSKSGNWVLDTLLLKKVVSCASARKNSEITPGCGDASGNYSGTATNFRSANFCASGLNLSSGTPIFPTVVGGSTDWVCRPSLLSTIFTNKKPVVCSATKGSAQSY